MPSQPAMTAPGKTSSTAPKRIGIAADHGGFDLKEKLSARFTGAARHRRRLAKVARLEREDGN